MSNEPYKAQEIEQKWRRQWEARGMHTVTETDPRPKYYCLDMFPYPSGSGLRGALARLCPLGRLEPL